MGEQPGKQNMSAGLLAHVDAGKTTLSEALLYCAGATRTLGRVDHRDAFLDTHSLEQARGITIFSKQARLHTEHHAITLVDTPGHVDFSAETERTLSVLDCAVLVISATDGVQAHTVTLWRLLEAYRVPTFLFVNKTDLPGFDREKLMNELQRELSPGCVDFGAPADEVAENAAMCDEALLESYLATGTLTAGNLRGLIAARKLFPCCFGAALKTEGVPELLDILDTYAPETAYPAEFSARVYKIAYDAQGNRLTFLKVTGGSLRVRDTVHYVNRSSAPLDEKLVQLRLYSGDKFTAADEVQAGQLAAAVGLSATWAGQGLGAEPSGRDAVLEPVMTYRILLPAGTDPMTVLPKLRQLEEEDPQLHIVWEGRHLSVRLMGTVQLEIFRALAQQRFGLSLQLDAGHILYRETIASTVEGVGHFEPLRHYAEVHVKLSPAPRGSGLHFDTVCPADVLDESYQRLILTHMAEKAHRGVLTGSPVTDMTITLLAGRAHLKHTEGGDMRQATYRAIRQGLMQAKSVILEPWYRFTLTLPSPQIGRAITDMRAMSGEFDPPETGQELSTLHGRVPASTLSDYASQVAAYTQGRGRLQLAPDGYAPCHDPEAVTAQFGYDAEGDLDNTPDSVFCAHGAGFHVKWCDVPEYMHLSACLKAEKAPQVLPARMRIDDRELEKIMQREFGDIRRPQYGAASKPRPAGEEIVIRPPRQKYLIVDGYNVIFAWDALAETAASDLDAARRGLCDALSSYAGFKKCETVIVFDGYKVAGSRGEKTHFHNIRVVYTPEGVTADTYIESLAAEIGSNYAVTVASSDALIQLSSFRSGVLRMSARELVGELDRAHGEMRQFLKK